MLGEMIAAERAERGWTQEELAERAGLSSAMVEALNSCVQSKYGSPFDFMTSQSSFSWAPGMP